MDIEDSMYSTTADLLSLRYPSLTGATSPCGGGGSLLLSSPWPISSTPSPPSSLSSVSSSVSASSPSSSTSSLQTINEGTLLSLSSGSPSVQDLQVTSPLPTGSGGILEVSSSHHHHNTGGATVIFTTATTTGASGANGTGAALTLVDPVSSPGLEVAHAPGKSILCVHEQEHGDLIHFSTSNNNRSNQAATTSPTPSQLNHVNGNGNENRANTTTLLEAASSDDVDSCKAVDDTSGRDYGGNSNNTSAITDTDGNLFPTLILTAGGNSSDHVIPMRLYASLTSSNNVSTSSTTFNGSTILTTGTDVTTSGGDDDNATCILMTTRQDGDDCNGSDLHHVLLSGVAHHQDQGHQGAGGTFTLAGFTEQLGGGSEQNSTNLGTTTILMDDCFSTSANGVKGHSDHFSGTTTISHGKLKDILMNGMNSHNNHHLSHQQNLSSTNNGNGGEGYILRNLGATTANVYDNRVNNNGDGGTCQQQDGSQQTRFTILKEEDELVEELKLHSVDDQNSFNDAMTSIYQDSGAPHIMVSGSVGGTSGSSGGDPHMSQAIYNTGSILALTPSSLASSSYGTTITTNSVIWSNSGGIVESVGVGGGDGSTGGLIHFNDSSGDSSPFLLKDDIGDLDGIENDDLLEAKEEMDDDLYGDGEEGDGDDGTGVKGELKCKFCGFVCCSKSSLGIHERRHTGERPFACKYCGRLFNSAQCCKHHERLHTGDKPFQCSYCGKKYAVSTRLKRHERVHTREEPYKCTECNKTFRWFDAFRDHRNTHTGVPLYLCSVCGKTFTSYLKFYYHERGHLMKKERDRDRLAKQRLANGLAPTATPWPSKRVHYSRNRSVPVIHTIDILKSLQRNSSASVISSLSQQAQQLSSLLNVGGGTAKKAGGSGGGTKGQSKKSQGKASKKQQANNGNTNGMVCS